MAVYEVVLRFQDREEVRLTDRPLDVGNTLAIEGREWFVESREAKRGRAAARFICVQLRTASRDLRARSSALAGRSVELRQRLAAAESE